MTATNTSIESVRYIAHAPNVKRHEFDLEIDSDLRADLLADLILAVGSAIADTTGVNVSVISESAAGVYMVTPGETAV